MSYIKSRKHTVLPHAIAALAASLSAPMLAQAQTAPAAAASAAQATAAANTLPTVKATGERETSVSSNVKYTAPLVNTPQTIQVINEQVLREQAVTTLAEALRNSAGVSTFYVGENGNSTTGDAIYMRGYDASGSIFVDGIRDVGAISRDMFNVEQVEVIKGPAGSDAGRSSPTGYVNLITKKPTRDDSFTGQVTVGSASSKRATIDWNKTLGEPGSAGMALRLNALAQDNGVPGRDEIRNKRWAIAPSLAFGLGSPTRVIVDLLHMKQDNVPDGSVPTIGLPGYSSPDTTRAFIGQAPRVDPSNFYGTSSDFDKVTVDKASVRLEHDLGNGFKLSNTLAYGRNTQDYMLTAYLASSANLRTPSTTDLSTWTLARSTPTHKDQVNTIVANQFNISGAFKAGGIRHSVSGGIDLSSEKQKTWSYYGASSGTTQNVWNVPGVTQTGAWPAANLYNPDPNVTGYLRLRNGGTTVGKTDTVGAYLFDTLEFTPSLLLNLGLRYDRFKTNYDTHTLVTSGAAAGSFTDGALALSDSFVTGKIGVVWKPAANGSIYAGFATGKQPPGGSNFQLAAGGTGSNANRTDFKPQETRTYEIGTKWELLNKHLMLNGALYRTDVMNGVVQDPVNTTQYYQTGKQRVQGVELSVSGQITSAWTANASFTTMDTSIVNGPRVTADGTDTLAYTPRHAFSAWTTYQLMDGLSIGLGARNNAKLHRGTDGAIGTPQYIKAYTVFDAMASYRVSDNVDLQLNIANLADKDYVSAINKSGYRYTPGTPRSYKLSATVQF